MFKNLNFMFNLAAGFIKVSISKVSNFIIFCFFLGFMNLFFSITGFNYFNTSLITHPIFSFFKLVTLEGTPPIIFFKDFLIYLAGWEMSATYLYSFISMICIYLVFCFGMWFYFNNLNSKTPYVFLLGSLIISFLFSYPIFLKWLYVASPWSEYWVFPIYFMFLVVWFLIFLGFNMTKKLYPTSILMVIFLIFSFVGVGMLHQSLTTTSFFIEVEKVGVMVFLWDIYIKSGGGKGPSIPTEEVENFFLDEEGKLPVFWPKDNKGGSSDSFADLMWATSVDPKSCEDFAYFVNNYSKMDKSVKVVITSKY